jgi:Undecaprenyl-phosphate galactose phosphotransferase WbaP|nr:exopolysaccharide biosynthesis polyprenyl glycosylphosphotransferase [Neorhizobium tomejilense]
MTEGTDNRSNPLCGTASNLVSKERDGLVKALMAAVDIAAIMAAAALSFFLMTAMSAMFGVEYVGFSSLLDERFMALAATSACASLYFLFSGHYNMRIPFWEETRTVATASLLGLVIEGFLIFANKADVSRASMFMSWLIAPFAVMWARSVLRRILSIRGMVGTRAVVFGKPDEAARAADIVRSDRHLGITVSAHADTTNLAEATATLDAAKATDAIMALSCADGSEITLAAELRKRGYSICVIPPAMGMSSSMNVHYILGRDALLLSSRPEITPRLNRAAKRTFDVAVAGSLLAVLAVPMAVVAVAVAVDGGAPFFRHQRIGRGGRKFGCLKFRSMRVDAEQKLEEYLTANPSAREAWDRNRKLPDDPRITWIGRFIRKSSIDELPQLVNVIKGEMSLVGPRPVTESELDHYGEAGKLYMAVAPGVTGLWQVSGRSDLSYERRVALDAWYVENWSPWHDIAILSKTVPTVLGRGGAY